MNQLSEQVSSLINIHIELVYVHKQLLSHDKYYL